MQTNSTKTLGCRVAAPLALALLVLAGDVLAAEATATKQTAAYVPGELLVRFRDGTARASQRAVLAANGLEIVHEYHLTGAIHVRGASDVEAVAQSLARNPDLAYAEPNYIVQTDLAPNDPSYGQMWGLNNTGQTGGTADADIDAPEAWDILNDAGTVVVGIIDTGIDIDHPDLVDNLWRNPGEDGGAPNVDDDNNGYVDDIHGINAITGSGNPDDSGQNSGHGTHVAGTVGASGDNGTQVVGVAWNVQLMGCRFLGPVGGTTADAIECIEYTTMMGADLTNNSWGGAGFSAALKETIEAAGAQGILFVAAAGNQGSNADVSPHYPGAYDSPSILSVASTTHNDTLSGFSNYGTTSVDVAAPGSSILSTYNDGGTTLLSGTSMASPHVAGVAALILAAAPGFSPADVKAQLMSTVDPLGLAIASGGRINAFSAIASLDDPFVIAPETPSVGAGELLDLHGANFGDVQGSGFVTFGPQQAAVQSWSNTRIDVTVPALNPGSYDVSVTTDEGETSNVVGIAVVIPHYLMQNHANYWLGGGTAMGWQADDACWRYDLPAPFNFYGSWYSQVAVCSNGFLDFGNENPDFTNTTEEFLKRKMIAGLWDDLRTDVSGTDIYVGQPSPETIMFRWQAVRYEPRLPVNMAIVLNLVNGSINFLYGEGNSTLSPTVGVSRGNEVDFLLADHDGETLLHLADRVEFTAPCRDGDGDGFGSTGAPTCSQGSAVDCDDSDPGVNPGAIEIPFNGIDDDCDPSTPQGNCQSIASAEPAAAPSPWSLPLALLPAAVCAGALRRRRG